MKEYKPRNAVAAFIWLVLAIASTIISLMCAFGSEDGLALIAISLGCVCAIGMSSELAPS